MASTAPESSPAGPSPTITKPKPRPLELADDDAAEADTPGGSARPAARRRRCAAPHSHGSHGSIGPVPPGWSGQSAHS